MQQLISPNCSLLPIALLCLLTAIEACHPKNTLSPIARTQQSGIVPASDSLPNFEALAGSLLLNVKTESNYKAQEDSLALYSLDQLTQELDNDAQKMAFWLNIYNAFIQIKAKNDIELLKKDKNAFFKQKNISICGQQFSFDDIEHGILRRSKNKLSLGYLQKWFVGKTEKSLRVEKTDYRIHFALNCGAKSCPPIAFYESQFIDEQLRLATYNYIQSECVYKNDTLYVPKLFWWFMADFGGRAGMLNILKENEIERKFGLQDLQKVNIAYKEYDWDIYLENFE